jgi:hypothetical protein
MHSSVPAEVERVGLTEQRTPAAASVVEEVEVAVVRPLVLRTKGTSTWTAQPPDLASASSLPRTALFSSTKVHVTVAAIEWTVTFGAECAGLRAGGLQGDAPLRVQLGERGGGGQARGLVRNRDMYRDGGVAAPTSVCVGSPQLLTM